MSWLVPWANLDSWQRDAARLPLQDASIIQGEELCGKTLTLLHRARYLRELPSTSGSHPQIWVATEGMKNLLRSAAYLLQLDPTRIECYDDWCCRVYRSAIQDSLPTIPLIGGTDFGLIRIVARQAVQWSLAEPPSFDVLLVDEADAFSSEDICFMINSAKHVTLTAAGQKQAAEFGQLFEAEGHQRINAILPTSYRRNSCIAKLSALFQRAATNTTATRATSAASNEEETPTYYIAPDEEAEIARLSEVLRERLYLNESVGILLPRVRDAINVANALREFGMEVEVEANLISSAFLEPRFATNLPKAFTFESAQGLNFETVIIPRLTRRCYRGYDNDDFCTTLSKAIGMAAKWVYLSSALPYPLPQLERPDITERPDVLHILGDRRTSMSKESSKNERQDQAEFETIALDDLL